MLNYEFLGVGGGGGVISYHVTRELARLGHEVTIITSHFSGLKRRESLHGMDIHRVWTTRKHKTIATVLDMATYVLSAATLVLRTIGKKEYDMMYSFFALPTGILAYLVNKIYGTPYVVSLYGSDVPGFNPYRLRTIRNFMMPTFRAILRSSSGIVAVSHELRDLTKRIDPRFEVDVIPPGVDCKNFYPRDREREDRKVRILFLGRMDSVRKGIPYLFRAISELETKKPYEVLLVGDGPMRPEFERLAKEMRLTNVSFLGAVYGERMAELYRNCDIFTLPSLAEGTPVSILEAMASALPVVASSVGGIPNEIDETCGILVPPKDVEDLREALRDLVEDDEKRRRMGQGARKRAEEVFSWEVITRQYLEALRR